MLLARVKIPYHPIFYVPLLILHSSLVLRVVGGVSGGFALRREGGLANAGAVLLFSATLLVSIFWGRKTPNTKKAKRPG